MNGVRRPLRAMREVVLEDSDPDFNPCSHPSNSLLSTESDEFQKPCQKMDSFADEQVYLADDIWEKVLIKKLRKIHLPGSSGGCQGW